MKTKMAEPDLYALAEEAGHAFLAAVRKAIDQLPQRPDLTEPAEVLRTGLNRLRPESAEPVIAAASRALDTTLTSRPDRTLSTDALHRAAHMYLPAVMQALDAALTRFERQSDLDEAQQKVARLQEERRSVLSDLEAAVATADVAEVMRLRPRIEVELPAAIDRARLEVAELQLARAQIGQGRPRRRAQVAAEAEARARADLDEAQRRLAAAGQAVQAAVHDKAQADQLVKAADARVHRLASERDRLAEENTASLQDRLRRLAGLPPQRPQVAEEPESGRTDSSHPVHPPLGPRRRPIVTIGPMA